MSALARRPHGQWGRIQTDVRRLAHSDEGVMLSRRLRIRASALIVGSALCATMLLTCGAESAAE
ncbi:MAG: hypothetical protein ACKO97_08710, partial [Actinomycetota bacterium]